MSNPQRLRKPTRLDDGKAHGPDCWARTGHERCALEAARDLNMIRREFHAGQTRRFARAAGLTVLIEQWRARVELAEDIAAARAQLAAYRAEPRAMRGPSKKRRREAS